MAMFVNLRWVAPIMILTGLGGPVSADVITDWNEKAVAFVTKHRMLPPQAERVVASVQVAMFDAVNSVERRYRPYRLAVTTAKETAGCAGDPLVTIAFEQQLQCVSIVLIIIDDEDTGDISHEHLEFFSIS
jgi:hypothetical protein